MKKILLSAAAMLAAIVASAATIVNDQTYTGFENVNVDNAFELTLVVADKYMSSIEADELISDYVKAYIKGKTLFITVDEKSFTPEIKKALKSKGSIAPVLRATVYLPTAKEITISGSVTLNVPQTIVGDEITIKASDKSSIKQLLVQSHTAAINLANRATAKANFKCNVLDVCAGNSSVSDIAATVSTLRVDINGSADVTISSDVHTAELKTAGSSKLNVKGTTSKLVVNSSAYIDADALVVDAAEVSLESGAECYVNVKNHLLVTLQNSRLTYNGNPSIDVERILASTMIRSTDPKNKKK